MSAEEQYIPEGYYFKDDLDGGRLIKKDILSKLPTTDQEVEAYAKQVQQVIMENARKVRQVCQDSKPLASETKNG